MIQPINRRAINQGLRRWPINSTTNLAGGGSGLSSYAVNDNDPATVADFAGILNSGTAYYRTGGSDTTFASMFTFARSSSATYTNSSGNRTTASSGVARTGHHRWNGSSYVNKGILLETEARTNKFSNTTDLDGATWSILGTSSTITDDASIGPDGVLSMALYTEGNGTSERQGVATTSGISQTASQTHTISYYVKDANTRYVTIACVQASNSFFCATFDLTTKSRTQQDVGSSFGVFVDSYVEDVGNDILRISVTGNVVGTSIFPVICAATSGTPTIGSLGGEVMNGRSQASFYYSHMDCVLGTSPSSHIPTSGSTVTRAAETKSVAGSDLDASTTAMSFHLAGEETYADLATAGQIELFDWRVDANNRITVTIDTDGAKTGTITLTMVNGGSSASVAATTQLTPGLNKAFNVAWRVTGSEINIALDGTAATATATAIGVPDLSSASAAFEGRGSRSIFRQAGVDWTDSGIEAAST